MASPSCAASRAVSHVVIGARTTVQISSAIRCQAFDALKQAAREVGSVQIQNVASVTGNLCNASPAADGAPALLVLDAGWNCARAPARMRCCKTSSGNRRTAIEPGEIVTAIRIPKASIAGSSSFQKLGARRYLVISIAMAAARMVIGTDGRIERAAIAVGACSAVAQRLPELEAALVGSRPGREVEQAVAAALFAELSPIDDVRGSADYRRGAAREIVLRALRGALGEADAEIAA